MIALDTSSLVAYLSNARGGDVDAVEVALAERQACLPPAVLAELLSDPRLSARTAALFRALPQLSVTDGYWERVGALRADVIAQGRRALPTHSSHRAAWITRCRSSRAMPISATSAASGICSW
jgi:predicted nucleic acid-binding protein